LLTDPKYLGAQPGIIAALHTWSQTLVLHPHGHGLVTGGGRTADGSWKAVRHGFLLPARVVMAVLRGTMLDAIRRAWTCGELVRPEGLRPQQVRNLLNRLGHPRKTRWHVRIMERYAHGAGVVTYLARYLRGSPLKNGRLVAYDGAHVTFTYRARQEEADARPASPHQMTLPVAAFLQRWLLHVPVPQTRGVRSYGLYHPSHAGLAHSVCAAGGRPSGAVSHLWPAARVYGCHPAGRSPSPHLLGGVRRMRVAPLGSPTRGVVCLGIARGRLLQPGGSPPRGSRRQGQPSFLHVRGRPGQAPPG
jgi:hypothetical protein